MYKWLHVEESTSKKGRVAIFDATNTTVARRQELCNRARKEQVGLLFVESICDDMKILEQNYLSKLNNDDYREMDKTAAKEDFVKRVKAYEAVSHITVN
jgi:predicted kinase